jgi:hypothetical protein
MQQIPIDRLFSAESQSERSKRQGQEGDCLRLLEREALEALRVVGCTQRSRALSDNDLEVQQFESRRCNPNTLRSSKMRMSPKPLTPSNPVAATQNGRQFVPFNNQVRARTADIDRSLSAVRSPPPNSPEGQALQKMGARPWKGTVPSANAVEFIF